MLTRQAIVSVIVLAGITVSSALTLSAAGHIASDVIWSADTVLITDTVWVDNGKTLIVNAGTRVEFQGNYPLKVWGRILGQGVQSDSVVFTAKDTVAGWRGIRFDNTADANDTSRLSFCRIEYGRASGTGSDVRGGGVYIQDFSKVIIDHCLIRKNSGTSYGAGLTVWFASPVLKDNLFAENSGYAGGGLCIIGGSPELARNRLTQNTAAVGGGIYLLNAAVRMESHVISGNSAGNGGGVNCSNSSATVVNSLIAGNNATIGGGFYCPDLPLVLINCTVVNNQASLNSGGIRFSTTDPLASPILTNVILWGNFANNSGNQLGLENPTVHPKIRGCVVQGGQAAFSGPGTCSVYSNNLDLEPQFTDSGSGDFSLLQNSPCINMGMPDTASLNLPLLDLAGNARIYNGAIDRVDIGAYEYQGNPLKYVVLTNPGAGATLSAGTQSDITWTSVGTIGSVSMEYSADNGIIWKGIVASASNSGVFTWIVPDDVSSTCIIRMNEAADGSPLGQSDGPFAIGRGEFKLSSPNNGTERWKAGSVHDITWTSISGIGSVRLDYSTDSGTTWNPISASTPNNNLFAWTLPTTPSFSCKVRIRGIADAYPFDESDNVFVIYDSTVLPVCGRVTANTVWDADTIRVTCPILVDSNATLTIFPGTRVEFQGYFGLYVRGRILAQGTATDSILFTARDTAAGWYGIRFDSVNAAQDTSKIQYCRIQHGWANGSGHDAYGGGIFVGTTSKLIVTRCTITKNRASMGGGGIAALSCSPVISNNTINFNRTTGSTFAFGGGIVCVGGAAPDISGNLITRNTSSNHGGGVDCESSSPLLTNNVISFNTAVGDGGGVRMMSASPILVGNVIYSNTAARGGAAHCYQSAPQFTACTILGNSAGNGGGIYCYWYASPGFNSCILRGNSGVQVRHQDATSLAAFTYCNVQGGMAGTGNIDALPLFQDSVNGNFALMVNSPGVNSGASDTAGLRLPVFDLAGNARISGGRLDMGAYEYPDETTVENTEPAEVFMAQNHPNPFNPVTTIRLGIPGRMAGVQTRLLIYDVDGRLVRRLIEGQLPPGFHEVEWNSLDETGKPVKSGFYVIKFTVGAYQRVIRCVLLK